MEFLFGLDAQLLFNTLLMIVSVFFLFLAMSYLLFNPVRKMLEDRQAKIASDIDTAIADKEEAAKLKAEYPAEFAEIQKLRDEAEKKLQELAKKANVELPAIPKSWPERMAELKAKYPKEFAEYEELQKTDRRAAFAKLRELMEKNGEKMNFPGRRENSTPPPPPRENQGRKMKELREKYPNEFAEIQKVRSTDPKKAREMTAELLKKLNNESSK